MGFSLGSLDLGQSRASTNSSSTQEVYLDQLFSRYFQSAFGAAGGVNTNQMTQTANQLFASGTGFLSELESIAGGTDEAGQYLQGRMNGEGSTVDDEIAMLSSDLDKFFSESLLPGIQGDAVAVGQLGGGRHQVAQGQAAEAVTGELARGSVGIRARDRQERDAIAGQLQQSRMGASGMALNFLPQMQDFANNAAMAPMSPFLALSQILGDPTVLTQSRSDTKARSWNFGMSGMGTGE